MGETQATGAAITHRRCGATFRITFDQLRLGHRWKVLDLSRGHVPWEVWDGEARRRET